MRTTICAVAVALSLLMFSCTKEAPGNQTETAANRTDTGTTMATTTAASTTATSTTDTAASLRVATATEHVMAMRALRGTLPTPPANTLRVLFSGMVVHVLDKGGSGASGVERAVVVNAASHSPIIDFPATMQTDLETAFGRANVTCAASICVVPFKALAFRVADQTGTPPTASFSPSPNFRRIVTHLLTGVPGGSTIFSRANLDGDIFGTEPKPAGNVNGFFELAGGSGDAKRFSCQARFHGQSTFVDFPKTVIVDFPLLTGTQLQVRMPGGNWKKLVDLSGSPVVDVTNMNTSSMGTSDFNSFTNLSTKPKTLPTVDKDTTDCTLAHGDVPGCSNSQWP